MAGTTLTSRTIEQFLDGEDRVSCRFLAADRVSRMGCVCHKPHLPGLVCPKPRTDTPPGPCPQPRVTS
jgi:hypothetical protein